METARQSSRERKERVVRLAMGERSVRDSQFSIRNSDKLRMQEIAEMSVRAGQSCKVSFFRGVRGEKLGKRAKVSQAEICRSVSAWRPVSMERSEMDSQYSRKRLLRFGRLARGERSVMDSQCSRKRLVRFGSLAMGERSVREV